MPDPTEELFSEEVLEAPIITPPQKPVKKILKKPKKYAKEQKQRVKDAKESTALPTLPAPPAKKTQPLSFFKWADSFSPEEVGRAEFRFYRDWPVINLKLIDKKSEKCVATILGDGLPFDADNWEQYILDNPEWGGSGVYRVFCNETGVPKEISWTQVELDDVLYPPRVDPRSLVVGHPKNEGYIAGLRARGMRMPGDDPSLDLTDKKEQEEMEVATKLMEAHEKETERLHEQIEELQEKLVENRTESPDASMLASATSEVVKVMGDGTRTVIGMVAEQAREMSKATAPSWNPVELFKCGLEANRGNGDGGITAITQFLTTMLEQQKDETKYWRDQAIENKAVAAEDGKPKSFVDQIREFKEIGDVMGWKTSGRRESNGESQSVASSEPAKTAWYESLGEKLVENPAMLITGLALFTNLVQSVMGKGKPAEVVMAEAKALADGMGGQQQPTAAQPAVQDPAQAQKARYENFMNMLTPLFVKHFFDQKSEGLSGFTFASEFMTMHESMAGGVAFGGEEETEYGRGQYDQIKRMGSTPELTFQKLDQMLRNWPMLWNDVQGQMPKYIAFLKEFLSFDEEVERLASSATAN